MGAFATGYSGDGTRSRAVNLPRHVPFADNFVLDRSPSSLPLSHFTQYDVRFTRDDWGSRNLPPVAGDTNVAFSADAVVALPAHATGLGHLITDVAWGYHSTPEAGMFSIESPSGAPIFGPIPVTAAGPGFFTFPGGLRCPKGREAVVRLHSGGAGVSGSVSITGRRFE